MECFRVVGEGAQFSAGIEKVAATAVEAERHANQIRRLCGRTGAVTVYARGRLISWERLTKLATAERDAERAGDVAS